MSYAFAEQLRGSRSLARDPESTRIWLKDGEFYEAGDRLVLPDLAKTLTRISTNGPDEFYTGETATTFAAAMKAHGGLITMADLAAYKAVERTPLTGRYRNYTVIASPPPSSGGVGLLQMLGMLDGTGYEKTGAESAASMHYVAEVMRRFYADRNAYLGDPDFVKNPIAALLDRRTLRRGARRSICEGHAERARRAGLAAGHGERRDDALQRRRRRGKRRRGHLHAERRLRQRHHRARARLPDQQRDGRLHVEAGCGEPLRPGAGRGQYDRAGKRPLSSMAPTIVLKDGQLYMLLGGPGGSRIPTAVLQVFLNVVDFGMNPQEAVDAPRFHHQWLPDAIGSSAAFRRMRWRCCARADTK